MNWRVRSRRLQASEEQRRSSVKTSRFARARKASFGRLALARVVLSAGSKRLGQHAVKPLLCDLAELLDTDGHAEVASRGLVAVGLEQPIPPRQVEAKVA